MQLAIFSKWSCPRWVSLSGPDVAPEGFCVVASEAFLIGSIDVLPFCCPEFPAAVFLELTEDRSVVLRPGSLKHPILSFDHPPKWGSWPSFLLQWCPLRYSCRLWAFPSLSFQICSTCVLSCGVSGAWHQSLRLQHHGLRYQGQSLKSWRGWGLM